ncbi:dynein regulatory complex protein 9-like [Physella acuta]|uniref:dynein regulatory complex protein 9-like n=1 Tax=Physella acuta TaxID=109671 RepID=UPI0027DB8BE2|nr:dynein regulatory complex protein 9-like [Physella acuta]
MSVEERSSSPKEAEIALVAAVSLTDFDEVSLRKGEVETRPFLLEAPQALHIVILLEEFVDKLEVLTSAYKSRYIDVRAKQSIIFEHARNRRFFKTGRIGQMISNENKNYLVKQHYGSSIPRKLVYAFRKQPYTEIDLETFAKEKGQKFDSEDSKLQYDRAFFELIITKTMNNLLRNNSYEYLAQVVNDEKDKKIHMLTMFKKIIDDTARIKFLKQEKNQLKKEKLKEIDALDAQIVQVKNSILELQFRKPLEAEYVKNFGRVMVERVRKMCSINEGQMAEKLKAVKGAMFNEISCHDSMMKIIKRQHHKLKKVLSFWVEKFEKDNSRLQAELDELKTERAKALARIAFLREKIVDYQEIVDDDRRIKKKADDLQERKIFEGKRATRIQAWWRGTMCRNNLGPYRNLFKDLVSKHINKKK